LHNNLKIIIFNIHTQGFRFLYITKTQNKMLTLNFQALYLMQMFGFI